MGNDARRAAFPIHGVSLNGSMSAVMVLAGVGMLLRVPLLALIALPVLGAMAIGALCGLALFLSRLKD